MKKKGLKADIKIKDLLKSPQKQILQKMGDYQAHFAKINRMKKSVNKQCLLDTPRTVPV